MPLDVVFADGLAFHDPFEGGFAVDDVGVGGLGDVAEGEVVVIVDGGLTARQNRQGFGIAPLSKDCQYPMSAMIVPG